MAEIPQSRLEIISNDAISVPDAVEAERRLLGPSETEEGMRFLLKYGRVLAIRDKETGRLVGLAESLNLDYFLRPTLQMVLQNVAEQLDALPPESPLRKALENQRQSRMLSQVMEQYPERRNYHYIHGIAFDNDIVWNNLIIFSKKVQDIAGKDGSLFGYALADRLSLPSLRIFLKHGGIIDREEADVYMPRERYLRVVYDRNLKIGTERKYLHLESGFSGMTSLLEQGFVGTGFEGSRMAFKRKL